MKKILSCLILAVTSTTIYAQQEMRNVYISEDVSIHFRSPEPIQYVDISSNEVIGDLPVENILRIKYFKEEVEEDSETSIKKNLYKWANGDEKNIATITVVGQSFMAQFRVHYVHHRDQIYQPLEFEITPEDMKPLEFPSMTMTQNEMRDFSFQFLKRKATFNNVQSKSLGLVSKLNNIYSVGDYVFIDVSYKNNTNLKYDIDEFRFKIEDKKIVKATNVQEIEIKPEYVLYNNKSFRNNFRNIYVFKKFTFPNSKVLNIQLTEKQISGRMIELKIDYRDVLNADTL